MTQVPALPVHPTIEVPELIGYAALALHGQSAPAFMSNIDLGGLDGARLLLKCTEPADIEIESLGEHGFPMRYWYVAKAEYLQDDGEIHPGMRTVLVSPQLQTLALNSDVALGDLGRIVAMLGRGPYEPPIPLTVVEFRSARGRTFYKLRIV